MPAGPMAQAPKPGDINQAVDPQPGSIPPEVQPFEQFIAPVPTNQSTTKPRQTPSDGGGASQPGLGDDSALNPASNGADLAAEEPAEEPKQPAPPVQASRHRTYVMADVMADVLESNPGLGERQAFLLAKRVVEEFPVTKEARETPNPLAFGDRGRVEDGPITRSIGRPKPGESVQVPAESPSRHQDTVQPEHAPLVLGPGRAPQALDGTIVEPTEIGSGPPGIDPNPGAIQMTQDENQVWHAAARKAVQR